MELFSRHVGRWTGSNAFRLMPADPPHVAAATADVSAAAAGKLTAIAYTWSHPDDGVQDGLLVIGPSDEEQGAVAFWGDSWHQSPAPTVLAGGFVDDRLVVSYEYGGEWRWQIIVDATNPDSLRLSMENVVPEAAATDTVAPGPYVAMLADLRRHS